RKKNRLSTKAMRTMFHSWQRRAGFEGRYTFHNLRHSAITTVQRLGRDIKLTQKFARHKSSSSTERYTHPSLEDLFCAVQEIRC
ncbi:MAG: phage integrase family protein, partial [Proteobacteria bacterium]|nr:phage integrase family protein [Pseudomonadota bacterium]